VIVVWAAMRQMGSVEGAFNDIWGVKKARSLVRRVTDYLAIVIAVPIFLVVAIGAATVMRSERVLSVLSNDLHLGPLVEALVLLAPKLGGWLVFTFVYLVLPNTRSRIGSALLGGFFASALWQLTLIAMVRFQVGMANYNEFYAGFAAIPALLVWIQVSWLIVLLGAEIAFAHEHEPAYRGMASHRALSHRGRVALALRAVLRTTLSFLEGGPRPTVAALAAEFGVQPRAVEGVLNALEQAGLLAAVDEDGQGGATFVLARDPGSIRIKQVADALSTAGDEEGELPERMGADETIDRLLRRLDGELAGSASNIDLRELARRARHDGRELPEGAHEPGVQLP